MVGSIRVTCRSKIVKFSSGQPMQWPVVRPSVVSFSHFRHLLQNHKLDWVVGDIVATWRFRIAKIVPFHYPRWPPWWPSKFFRWHLLLNPKSDWAKTWWEASQSHRDSKLLKSFRSFIQDGHLEAILKFFKRHLLNPKSDRAETWWEASQWHRDSKSLKSFHSDIQDGCHAGHLEILQTTSPPKP